MQNKSTTDRAASRIPNFIRGPLLVCLLLLNAPLFGQQSYVGRFDAFAGFTYLNSPHISLPERGLHAQIGIRPSCGLIRERAIPHPGDAIAAAIVAQLAPSGEKKDLAVFYGFGGGVDFNIAKHVAIRVQADLVRDHLFDDLLADSRNTVRFSIGPGFQWGKNVVK
jgi:hypothetical protein